MTTPTSRLDRLLAAYPLVLAYVLLLILYAWQTTKHVTPWLFTDELQWASESRGVAHHGVEQLRGHDVSFDSLYAYLIAPAWWTTGTSAGYAAAKYINAIVMTASLFPAYALARLFVPRLPAVACGAATAAIPALVYADLLIPEPFAYFWSTLALWLAARALVRPGRLSIAFAVLALLVAPAVRSELTVLILAAAIGGLVLAATSARGRMVVGGWSTRERIGVALLVLGAVIALGALGNHHSSSWEIGTHFHHRMLTYGLWAVGAFTIGVGVLPVVVALTWLLGNPFRTLEDRALGGLFAGTAFTLCLYTAVKASYLSTNFAIRVEERNLIYAAPVVFAVLARWAVAGRSRLVPLALSGAAVWYLLHTTPNYTSQHLYSDAPGYSALQWLNQRIYFTNTDATRLLYGILIGTVVAMLAREWLRRRPFGRRLAIPAGVVLAVAVVGWNLWGEIGAADGARDYAKAQRALLPTPPDWIDQTTRHHRTLFIGQSLSGSSAFWSIEFWNQTVHDVWSVDASTPQPGPTITPDYADTSGTMRPQLPVDWVVTTPGVDPHGTLVTSVGGGSLRLFHVPRPIRLLDAYGGLSPDAAWMTTSAFYYRFAPPGARAGTMTVRLTRAAACGSFAASPITVRLSRLRIDQYRQPAAGRALALRHVLLRSNPCDTKTISFHVRPPFRVDLSTPKTFLAPDGRQLSAQVTFAFAPG